MANNFLSDANCIALWDYESAAKTADSIGSHTLTDNNTVVVETTDKKRGDACAEFSLTNNRYYSLLDSASPAPVKSGTGTGIFSVVGWVKFFSFGTTGVIYPVVSKYTTADNKRCFAIGVTADKWKLLLGYNSGATSESIYESTAAASANVWYHYGFTFNQTTKAWTFRVWNDTTQAVVLNVSGTTTNNMSMTTAPFYIGKYAALDALPGREDETAFFSDILTSDEIDDIRTNTYLDSTAPSLTSPTGTKTGATTATGTVTTNEADGTLYAVVTTSATPPSSADLKSGTGAAYSTNQAVTTTGVQNVAATSLTAATTYYWHFLHTDAAANDSSIASSTSFTTDSGTAVKGLQVTLYNKSSQAIQASLTGITARYWDSATAAGAPLLKTDTASTNGSGLIEIDIDSVTSLSVGGVGYLVLYKAGAGIQTDLHFASRVTVVDIS